MNPRTHRHSSFEQRFPYAEEGRVPSIGYPANLQNLYDLGMTQAVEFSKSAFSTAVCMNSCVMDFCRHFFWYPMGLEYWFEAQKEAYAQLMDFGTQCLCGFGHLGHTARGVHRRKPTARQMAEKEKEMEDGMDVAVEAFEEEILA